jgi:hypothetical protein
MKILYTIFLSLLIISFGAHAQDISISSKSSDSISADKFTEMTAYVVVENTGTDSNTYKVERIELSMTVNHSSYFCWSIDCYNPDVSLSTSSVTIAPSETNSTFYGYLTPYDSIGAYTGTSVVKYKFFNTDGAKLNDTVSVVFVYSATEVSSLSRTRILGDNDFYAYPNPAVNSLNIAFGDIKGFSNGQIVVRNILGSELINQKINLSSNLESIDVSKLGRGVYFYSVLLDGKTVQTKKFAVTK